MRVDVTRAAGNVVRLSAVGARAGAVGIVPRANSENKPAPHTVECTAACLGGSVFAPRASANRAIL